MYKIILINGKARVGKDTLANFMVNEFNKRGYHSVFVRGNAQTVKDYATKYFKWDGNKTNEGRKLLINITNMFYDLDPTYWEKKSMEFVTDIHTSNPLAKDTILIIPDWRYLNTYKFFNRVAIQDTDFSLHTIHLDRKGFENNLSKELKDDISESDLLKDIADIHIYKQTSDLNRFLRIAERTVERILKE